MFESAGLEVYAENIMVFLGWGFRSTLILATQVSGKLYLPVNCRFASTLDHLLDLPLEVNIRKAWELGGRRWPAASRMNAPHVIYPGPL